MGKLISRIHRLWWLHEKLLPYYIFRPTFSNASPWTGKLHTKDCTKHLCFGHQKVLHLGDNECLCILSSVTLAYHLDFFTVCYYATMLLW